MKLRIAASTFAALTVATFAVAQTPKTDEDHSAHHPPGSATAPTAVSPMAPEAIDKQMKAMQDMHQRMQSAKTPAERAALMDEHMKLMQSGMSMMGMHQQMEKRMAMVEQMMQMMVDREAAKPRK